MSTHETGVLSLNKGATSPRKGPSERLHKVLANAGLGSRRMLEGRIREGDIDINGSPAEIGASVATGDRVAIDQRQFVVAPDHGENAQVIAYNKPEGLLTTRDDPEGRDTVFDQLTDPVGQRWIAVGRLDTNTTGLLLLTTDGELANALMHPSSEIDREYLCRVHGEVSDDLLQRLQEGVELDDGQARFEQVVSLESHASHAWFRVVLREGRNREVRRMWEAVDCEVSRLKRIRYGCITLPRSLKRGDNQPLQAGAVKELRKLVGLDKPGITLTLKPVSGQRRAQRTPTRIEPSAHKPSAWVGGARDEARELSAWDRGRTRPDDRRGGPGGRRRKPGKEVNGNLIQPENNRPKQRKSRRKAAPGQELPAVRSWFAGDGATKGGRDNKNPGNRSGGRNKKSPQGRGKHRH